MMDQIESFRGVEKTKISCLKQNSFKIVTLLYFHIRSCIQMFEFYNDRVSSRQKNSIRFVKCELVLNHHAIFKNLQFNLSLLFSNVRLQACWRRADIDDIMLMTIFGCW